MPMAPTVLPTSAGKARLSCLSAAVTLLVISLGMAKLCHAQANKDDLAATVARLNKKALDEYDNLNFEEARKILKDALDFCREAGLDQHPVTARTNMHLGVVTLAGFKQREAAARYFRKALEIEPDIKLTKSLANPEIQAAFDEAVASVAPKVATKSGPAGVGASARSGSDSGIAHEPVTRAARGQAVTISATIDPALNADRIVLSYRAADSVEFAVRDMTEATPGNFTAEIPATATGGAKVAYAIEVQRGGQSVANLGSKGSPLVVTLAGPSTAGIRRAHKQPAATQATGEAGGRIFVGMAVGTGLGWASGAGEINAMHVADPAGFAPAQIVHLAPEIGYFLRSDLLLSLQARIQFVSGPTSENCPACASPPSSAFAAFAKLTWLFGSDNLKPYLSAAVGGGRIRYVARFPQDTTCGNGTATCVESIPSGAVMLGPGGGIFYAVTPGFGFLAGANSQLGFPRFTFNLDFNVGVAAQF